MMPTERMMQILVMNMTTYHLFLVASSERQSEVYREEVKNGRVQISFWKYQSKLELNNVNQTKISAFYNQVVMSTHV